MTRPEFIKSSGYAISTLSVMLLGVSSWKNAASHPLIMVCLLVGMAASIAGMGLRWWSYRIDKE